MALIKTLQQYNELTYVGVVWMLALMMIAVDLIFYDFNPFLTLIPVGVMTGLAFGLDSLVAKEVKIAFLEKELEKLKAKS